ncbi:acyl carrier protein [Crocosphaera sp. Alani8]|uniref:acyl carrier protein n=1 Tax=Crocosphaera sp. Alani8 TaxID=3038952 RepID=UPI00313DE921
MSPLNAPAEVISPKTIQDWLVVRVATQLNMQPEDVGVDIPFDRYNLESYDVVSIMAELEDWLEQEFNDPTLMYQYNTIATLSQYLGNHLLAVNESNP